MRFRLDCVSKGMSESGHRSSFAGDSLGDGAAALIDMKRELAQNEAEEGPFIANAIELCRKAGIEGRAMYMRYVLGLSWGQVARRVGYSDSHVKGYMQDKAAMELYPKIPEEYRRYTFPNAAPK